MGLVVEGWLSVSCFSATAGSGDQYEAPVFGFVFVDFLSDLLDFVGALRGFVTALRWTLVASLGAALWSSGALVVGMEPSRAERLSDILE